jgi:Mn-containing catalase
MKIFCCYIKELYSLSRGRIMLNLFLMVVLGTLEGIGILLLIPLLHFAGIGEMPQTTLGISFSLGGFSKSISPELSLPVVLIIYMGLIVMQSGLQRYQSNLSVRIQQSLHSHLSIRIFQGLAYAKWPFLAAKKKSDLTTIFASELARVSGGTHFFFRLTATAILAVIQVLIAFLLSPLLTLLVIGGGLVFYVLTRNQVRQVKEMCTMFKHDKALLHEVRVDSPNPNYAAMLQEQLGGPQGELKAAMQYLSQSFRIKDPQIKDLFLDIAAEELSHMEMVATTINLLNGHVLDANNATIGAIEAHVLTGLTPLLSNASGQLWTAAYVNQTGDLAADLLSNIAAEQRAKVVYEYLYRQINDKGVRETIDFLLNREEAHNTMFREAFNRIQDSGSLQDWGVTKDSKLYFDLSTPGGQNFDASNAQPPSFTNPNPTHN